MKRMSTDKNLVAVAELFKICVDPPPYPAGQVCTSVAKI